MADGNLNNGSDFLTIEDIPIPDLSPEPGSIWDDLLQTITAQVKEDGIRPDSIQEGETEEDVFNDAVTQIYYDVSAFYEWYFNPDTDQYAFVKSQKQVEVPADLYDVVKPNVDDNLDAMREVDEIPTGQDIDGLDDVITDSLSRYIINWQDWYYDRKEEEAIDSYFEQKSFYDDIYLDTDYGQLSNLQDDDTYDGISDVPYIAEPL